MPDSFDQSHLDNLYFIDTEKYNCPFCKRRHVVYFVHEKHSFDWTNEKRVYIYIARCNSCKKDSLHFSNFDIEIFNSKFYKIVLEDKEGNEQKIYLQTAVGNQELKLDNLFFYKKPTSSFTLDSRIHKKIRELITEAQGCKDLGYLVGASGALRKSIYEFLKLEKASGEHYEDKIKLLKSKFPRVSGVLFDALSNIQDMASENLHEMKDDWKAFTSDEFEYFIEIFIKLLDYIYVRPDDEKKDLEKISELKRKLSPKPQSTPTTN